MTPFDRPFPKGDELAGLQSRLFDLPTGMTLAEAGQTITRALLPMAETGRPTVATARGPAAGLARLLTGTGDR